MHPTSSSRRRLTRALIVLAALSWFVGPGAPSAVAQATVVEGQTGDGSSYGLAMPGAWNGDLVVYAHGIVDPGAPLALPSSQDGFTALRGLLLDRGYALAYSSFSENGYSLKSAIQRTHQLSLGQVACRTEQDHIERIELQVVCHTDIIEAQLNI